MDAAGINPIIRGILARRTGAEPTEGWITDEMVRTWKVPRRPEDDRWNALRARMVVDA
jgi:hypothetical protein